MRVLGAAVAVTVSLFLALLALAAGVGWLYALYRGELLALGPRVTHALPLEALAGHAGQPLLRFAAAWLAAGAAIGLIMRATRMNPRVALPAFAVAAAIVLVAANAVSDALTQNQRVIDHVVPQLGATANLAAWAALVAGAVMTQRRPSRPSAADRRGIHRMPSAHHAGRRALARARLHQEEHRDGASATPPALRRLAVEELREL
jgi:hypothetical protein